MERLIELKGGPFSLNTSKDVHDLGEYEANYLSNADLFATALQGMYGPGSSVQTLGAGSWASMFYAQGLSTNGGWQPSTSLEYHCYDAINSNNSHHIAYTTDLARQWSTNSKSQWWDGVNFRLLGLNAPTNAQATLHNGNSGSARAYYVTAVSNKNGITIESNPTFIGSILNSTNAVIDFTAIGTDSDNGQVTHKNIYASVVGSSGAPYYYLAQVTDATASWTDNGSASASGAQVLNWGVGGNASSTSTPYDHSPVPSLGIISESLYGGTANSGSPGMGILFGAIDGSWLTWSQLNYPWYWPTVNYMRMPENIEAITADQQIAYVFCNTCIYGVTGADDQHLDIERTRAPIGILPGCGKTLRRVSGGYVFLSRLGLTFFDGFNTVSLTDGILDPEASNFFTHTWGGAYWDGLYYLYALGVNVPSFVFNLSNGLDRVRITECTVHPNYIHTTPYYATPGMYTLTGSAIQPWMPREQGSIAGASQLTWSYYGPKTDCGVPQAQKRAMRLAVFNSGDATVNVQAGGGPYGTGSGFSSSNSLSWIPPGFDGEWVQFQISSAAGTGVLNRATLLGSVLDGAS